MLLDDDEDEDNEEEIDDELTLDEVKDVEVVVVLDLPDRAKNAAPAITMITITTTTIMKLDFKISDQQASASLFIDLGLHSASMTD